MKSMFNEGGGRGTVVVSVLRTSPRARAIFVGLIALVTVLVATAGSPRAAGTFDPKVTFEVSTTQATAHPDARITIDNTASSEKLKAVTLNLPKGFWGSLAAVETKCSYDDAAAGNCDPSTKVGTVKASAKVDDSDVVLRGDVFLTTPGDVGGHDYSGIDPAWLSVKIVPNVGGVTSFDPIITPGRVIVRNRALPVPKSGAVTGPESIQTQIGGIDGYPDIPASVTDSNTRTINFALQKIAVDLKSNLSASAPLQPLLTNPSSCGVNPVSASFTGWEDGTAPGVTDASGPFTVTGCDKVKFRPSSVDVSLTDPTVNTATGVHGDIQFPDNSASIASAKIVMPPNVSFNSLGSAFNSAYMCPASSASTSPVDPNPYFIPSQCTVAENQIGTATIYSPLVSTPLKAKVMFISRGSTPSIAIYADSTTDGGSGTNPKGMSIAVLGINSVKDPAPDCPVSDGCPQALQTEMRVIPDAPVSRIVFDIDYSPDTPRTLADSKILKVGTPGDPSCTPYTDFTAEFTSNSSTNPPGNTPVTASHVVPQTLSGCDAHAFSIDGLTTDASVNLASTATPSFAFSPDNIYCAFGSVSIIYSAADTCTTPASPESNVPTGVNSFIVSPDQGEIAYRRYSKQTPLTLPETDTTAPTGLNFTDQPTDPTSDTTPSASYTATGASAFQCSLDGGAYLPCGTGSSGTYTVPDSQELIPGDATHTIAVRASDDAGNVSAPESASFKVAVPFNPTFDVALSTTAARQHPAMDVTITSGSHEDLKNLSLSLPDGFLGGLTGVQTLCPIATANVSACTAASEVGTVETAAIVDESTVRLPGKVYMTEPIQVGDPAGLYVDIPAKLQDVDMGHVTVPIRLNVRGQAQGIDTFATNLPTGIDPNNGIDAHTDFDLRSIAIKLRDNPLAPQPLLTNPSQCGAGAFTAGFTGTGDTTVTKSVPFQAANCSALGFAPNLSITQVERATGGPPGPSDNIRRAIIDLSASLTADPAGSGIRAVNLTMPHPITIDVQRLPFPCTDEQAALKACPASAAVGNVTAISPLLPTPLTGLVYILKSQTSLPRLLVALRGVIDVDLIATNSFVNVNQIVTNFANLPDVPLSSFTMNVNGFLTTRSDSCDYGPDEWNVVGTLGGQNGASTGVNIPLKFDCPGAYGPVYSAKFKNRGKKNSKLWVTVQSQTGKKLKKVKIRLAKNLYLNRAVFKSHRRMARLVRVTIDGKRLRTKCYKYRTKSILDIGLCGHKRSEVKVTFGTGSLISRTKTKKPKLKVTVTDSSNKRKMAKTS